MSGNQSKLSRRKLLKSIAAGSGAIVAGKSLPESWSRPVVDSVILPAHAQTSPPAPPAPSTGPFAGGVTQTNGMLETGSLLAKVTDSLIPDANAGQGSGCNLTATYYVCVVPSADLNSAKVTAYEDYGLNAGRDAVSYTWENVPVGGSSTDAATDKNVNGCPEPDLGYNLIEDLGLINEAHASDVIECSLTSVTGTAQGSININGKGGSFNVGPGSCMPTLNCKVPDCDDV